MTPIGIGITLISYTVGVWGYCLVRGYNVKFTQLFATTWPAAGSSSSATQGATPGTTPGAANPPPPAASSGPAPRG
jgi:hypothetical protein